MAVRSKRLFGPVAVSASWSVTYTCPAGRTALIKALWINNTHATDATTLTIAINGQAAGARLLVVSLAASTSIQVNVPFVLEPGDTLNAIKGTNGSMVYSGHGSLLLGAPS